MKNFTLSAVVLFFSILSISTAYSQIEHADFNKEQELERMTNVPNSPEAQAFTKYGNTSVSMYTGTPNINVPIYTHKGRELDLPINLTYDASGIKVEQLATSVGLGWNLNAGGRVSRITNGAPDDYYPTTTSQYKTIWDNDVNASVLLYTSEHQTFPSQAAGIAYLDFLKKTNDNEYDTQPDYFSFNALGLSDMFIIDVASRTAKALNNPRIQVSCHKTTNQSNIPINQWTVTNDDGTVFEFNEPEVTWSQNDSDTSLENLWGMTKEYNSSWLLTKITSPNGKDVYDFVYTPSGGQTPTQTTLVQSVTNVVQVDVTNSNQEDYSDYSPTSIPIQVTTDSYVQQQILSEIKHNGKTIVEFTLENRYDFGESTAIDEIIIYKDHQNSEVYKKYDLIHDYFKTSSSTDPADPNVNKTNIRLKLESIDIKDANSTTVSDYEFDYIMPDNIAATNSLSQDYYGYYNGGNSSGVLYPKTNWTNVTTGADRMPDFNYSKRGLLEKITYPTGGHTLFTYGPNMSSESTDVGTAPVQPVYLGLASLSLSGGLLDIPFSESECPGNGCQDIYPNGPPKVAHKVFTVAEAGDYVLEHTQSNQYGTPDKATILFAWTLERGCGNGNPTPWYLYEVMDTGGNYGSWLVDNNMIIYDDTSDSTIDHTETVYLEAGCYQITIVNPEPGSGTSLKLGKWVAPDSDEITQGQMNPEPKAGIRVENIRDFASDGNLALEKAYHYSDGTVISQAFYEHITQSYTFDQATQEELVSKILHRRSYASSTNRPHIAYDKVIEKVVNFNDPDDCISTENSFYTDHSGSYFNGVYTYHIGGQETANNYAVTYELGKSKEVSAYNLNSSSPEVPVSKSTSEYYDKQFYKNSGMYLRTDEGDNDKFPTFTLINGEYEYTLIEGSRLLGPGGGTVTPPQECNQQGIPSDLCSPAIGRLKYHETRAFGKVGNIIGSTSEKDGVGDTMTYDYYDDETSSPYNFLLKQKTMTSSSKGEVMTLSFMYPENLTSEYLDLITNNMVNIPVQISTFLDGAWTLSRKTKFVGTQPSAIMTAKGDLSTSVNTTNLEDRLLFERYENNNLVQARSINGQPISYIWGYDNQYVVAKIENVTYSEIEDVLGLGFSLSNTGLSQVQDDNLRSGLSDAQITTYIYDPLVGITSMRSPTGYVTTYEYDDFHRLKLIKDEDGNILSKNEYNYANQN